jgi:selenocysteine lyase/cysteine desulfurase
MDNSRTFPITNNWTYLDHATLSPPPAPSAHAASRLTQLLSKQGLDAHKIILQKESLLLRRISNILTIPKSNILVFRDTTDSIIYLKERLPLKPNAKILGVGIPEKQAKTWHIGKSRHFETEFISAVEFDEIENSTDDNLSLLALNPINLPNGNVQDFEKFSHFCKKNKSLLLADLSFFIGINQISLQDLGIDIGIFETHRWLMGMPDVTIMCVSDRVARAMELPTNIPSFISGIRPQLPNIKQDLEENSLMDPMSLFSDLGSFASRSAVAESLRLIENIGMKSIQEKIGSFKTQAGNALREEGFSVFTSDDSTLFSGILSAENPKFSAEYLSNRLREQKVQVGWHGNRLLISPHFYNDENDAENLINKLHYIINKT